MKIIVKTNFPFNVQNIGFSSHGELIINLSSDNENPKNSYVYEAEFGESSASPKPIINLSSYIVSYLSKANIKEKTKHTPSQSLPQRTKPPVNTVSAFGCGTARRASAPSPILIRKPKPSAA